MADVARLFPVQTRARGISLFVPWEIGVAAWERYAAKYGRQQSAEEISRRHGFGEAEMDEYRPGWRDHAIEQAVPR